jgi:hypothetical protein
MGYDFESCHANIQWKCNADMNSELRKSRIINVKPVFIHMSLNMDKNMNIYMKGR